MSSFNQPLRLRDGMTSPPINQAGSRVRISFDRRKEGVMARKRYTAEEIIGQLRTIEIELGKGLAVVEACRKLGITEQTYYRWKKEYGGLRVDQAKRLKGLEQENARLKRLVADLALDNSIFKEVGAGKSLSP